MMRSKLAILSTLGLAAAFSAQAVAQTAPDLDSAVKASKPLFESDDANGHVTAATTTGCALALTLDSKQTATVKLGGKAKVEGNALTIDQVSGGTVSFTFRGDDADALAKAAEKAIGPVMDRCKA
jgi:hypothetical protein